MLAVDVGATRRGRRRGRDRPESSCRWSQLERGVVDDVTDSRQVRVRLRPCPARWPASTCSASGVAVPDGGRVAGVVGVERPAARHGRRRGGLVGRGRPLDSLVDRLVAGTFDSQSTVTALR